MFSDRVRCCLNSKKGSASRQGPGGEERQKKSFKKLDAESIKKINERWEDNEHSSYLWNVISEGKIMELFEVLQEYPEVAHVRSADGRGPMWWAHEYNRPKMIELLKKLGVSDELPDSSGRRPGE
jgi:dolichyl-diphosphooligosaccharide--protein glycosyltransferase